MTQCAHYRTVSESVKERCQKDLGHFGQCLAADGLRFGAHGRFDPSYAARNVAVAYAEAKQRGCITQQIFEELGFDCEVACAADLTIGQAIAAGRTFDEAFEAAARVLRGEPHEPIPLVARRRYWTLGEMADAYRAACQNWPGNSVAEFEAALGRELEGRGATPDEAARAVGAYATAPSVGESVRLGCALKLTEAGDMLIALGCGHDFPLRHGETKADRYDAIARAGADRKGPTREHKAAEQEAMPTPRREAHEAGPCPARFATKVCYRPGGHVGPHVSKSGSTWHGGAPLPDGRARCEACCEYGYNVAFRPDAPGATCEACAGLGHVPEGTRWVPTLRGAKLAKPAEPPEAVKPPYPTRRPPIDSPTGYDAAVLPEAVKALVESGRVLRAAITDVRKAIVVPASQSVVQLDAVTHAGPSALRSMCVYTPTPAAFERVPWLTEYGAELARRAFPCPPLVPGAPPYASPGSGDTYGSASWAAWAAWAATAEMRADPNVALRIARLAGVFGFGPVTSLDKAIASARADLAADEVRLPSADRYAAGLRRHNEAKRAALDDVAPNRDAAKGGAT